MEAVQDAATFSELGRVAYAAAPPQMPEDRRASPGRVAHVECVVFLVEFPQIIRHGHLSQWSGKAAQGQKSEGHAR
eukprot:symbB.v1.2.010593.t1/scaffold686.1/size316167/12